MITAIEVLTRRRETEKRLEPMHALLNRMTSDMMKRVLDIRVPLIKYGRRKRGYRRLFTGQIAAMKIEFDGSGLKPITNEQFYRQ